MSSSAARQALLEREEIINRAGRMEGSLMTSDKSSSMWTTTVTWKNTQINKHPRGELSQSGRWSATEWQYTG